MSAQYLSAQKSSRAALWAGYALIGLVLIAVPFAVDAALGRSWVRIMDVALLFTMLALGLNIVVGYAGLLDLGYVAFFAVGAYCYALLGSPQLGIHLPFFLVLPLCAFVAAIFGVLLGAPTLKLRGDYLAIVTLGFGEIVRIFLNNLNRPFNLTNGPQGITLVDPLQVGSFTLSKTYTLGPMTIAAVHSHYFVFLVCALLIILVSVRLEDSRIGRAWIAIREDEIAAKALGINTRNVKLLAFAMGATFGGVSGGLFAAFQGFVSPESFSLTESIAVLAMVVLGGMGHIPGVVLGGVILAALPEVLRHTVEPVQHALFGKVLVDAEILRQLLYGLAMVVIMLTRPAGLWPAPRHEDRPDADVDKPAPAT